MDKKFSIPWSNAAFYLCLAVCLIAVGTGGWFLLFGKEEPEVSAPVYETVADQPVETGVAPAETPPAEEFPVEEPPVAEVLASVEMPEEDIQPVFEDIPVVAEEPCLLVEPLEGEVVAAFSVSELQYDPTFDDWRIHDGVDIAAALGAAVLSASSGTVQSVTEDALMGVTVVIDHEDGYQTTYCNLAKDPMVLPGAKVGAGEVIGAVGDTALAESKQESHLHFSVTKDGDVVDPNEYLNQ